MKANPPVHRDLRRQIAIYAAKVQFDEMVFQGANLHMAKVQIPSEALPIKDQALRSMLETRMKVFSDLFGKAGFQEFLDFKETVERVRNDFLLP